MGHLENDKLTVVLSEPYVLVSVQGFALFMVDMTIKHKGKLIDVKIQDSDLETVIEVAEGRRDKILDKAATLDAHLAAHE